MQHWIIKLNFLIYFFKTLRCCSDLTSSSSSRSGVGAGQGPRFIYEPPSFQGFSNNTGGSLSCSAHGVPQPKISWLEGSTDQVVSLHIYISQLEPDSRPDWGNFITTLLLELHTDSSWPAILSCQFQHNYLSP